MKYVFTVLVLFVGLSAFPQGYQVNDDYVPPSPTAMSSITRVNTSVNEYNGVANINLPIVTLPGRKLSFPVSLAYSATGIKVQDVPTWVGTGWTLEAGGVITRIVRGLPDEGAKGFCGPEDIGEKAYQQPLSEEYISKAASNAWDSEPDLFYFDFMGKKGKFILDEQGTPVLLPHAPIKIVPGICNPGNSMWTIIDENGVTYTFGQAETSYNKQSENGTEKSHISSWYLTEVRTPGNEDVVLLSYQEGGEITYSYYRQEATNVTYQAGTYIDPDNQCIPGGEHNIYNRQLYIRIEKPIYLQRISTAKGSLEFSMALQRGIPQRMNRISSIVQKDMYGAVVNTFAFGHSYFTVAGCSNAECSRLKLDGVYQIAGNDRRQLFACQYNETVKLPARNSNHVDYWGYYNTNSQDTSKIPTVFDSDPLCRGTGEGTLYPGANRDADTVRVKACMLISITDVLGGVTEYAYSAHQYTDNEGNNKFAGGVRIRVIKQITAGETQKATYYYYKKFGTNISSGKIEQLPIFHFRSFARQNIPICIGTNCGFIVVDRDYLVIVSDAMKDLFNINGFHIGYSNVTVSEVGKGSIRTVFTDQDSNPDAPPEQYIYKSNMPVAISSEVFPYTPNITKAFERGLILKQEFLDSNGKLVQEKAFTYNLIDAPVLKSVPAIRSATRGVDNLYPSINAYHFGIYRHVSRPYVVRSFAVTKYDQLSPGTIGASNNRKVTILTEYSYVPVGTVASSNIPLDMQPRVVSEIMPTGEKMVTATKYVKDYGYSFLPAVASSTIDARSLYLLASQNMVTAPVESIKYLEKVIGGVTTKYLLSGQLTRYAEYPVSSKKVFVYMTYKLKASGNTTFTTYPWSEGSGFTFTYNSTAYKRVYEANYDDEVGNLIGSTGEDGIGLVREYSHNKTELASVQNSAGHMELYESKPLVGVAKHTDASGRVLRYEYNPMNELKIVYDSNGNITDRYRTGLKKVIAPAAPVGLNVVISGSQTINSTVTFTANLLDDVGYRWEFSTGDTITSWGTSTILRSFSSPGTYRLKVTTLGNTVSGDVVAELEFAIQ